MSPFLLAMLGLFCSGPELLGKGMCNANYRLGFSRRRQRLMFSNQGALSIPLKGAFSTVMSLKSINHLPILGHLRIQHFSNLVTPSKYGFSSEVLVIRVWKELDCVLLAGSTSNCEHVVCSTTEVAKQKEAKNLKNSNINNFQLQPCNCCQMPIFMEKKVDPEMQNKNSAESKAESMRSKQHIPTTYDPIFHEPHNRGEGDLSHILIHQKAFVCDWGEEYNYT